MILQTSFRIFLNLSILVLVMIMFNQNALAKVSVKECNEWKKTEKQLTSDLPRKIGTGSELTNFMINCDTKVIKYTKRLLIDVKLFKDGWMKRKQRQHIPTGKEAPQLKHDISALNDEQCNQNYQRLHHNPQIRR